MPGIMRAADRQSFASLFVMKVRRRGGHRALTNRGRTSREGDEALDDRFLGSWRKVPIEKLDEIFGEIGFGREGHVVPPTVPGDYGASDPFYSRSRVTSKNAEPLRRPRFSLKSRRAHGVLLTVTGTHVAIPFATTHSSAGPADIPSGTSTSAVCTAVPVATPIVEKL